jgi:hypothetical protein
MAVLTNPKHEAFAQLVAKGSAAGEAYRKVYKAKDEVCETSGPRLFRNPQVASRVAEIQEKGATKAAWTIETAIAYAEEVLETPVGDVDHNHRLCQERVYIVGREEDSVKVKMVSKDAMFDKLCKLRGWYAAEKVEGNLTVGVAPEVQEALTSLLG